MSFISNIFQSSAKRWVLGAGLRCYVSWLGGGQNRYAVMPSLPWDPCLLSQSYTLALGKTIKDTHVTPCIVSRLFAMCTDVSNKMFFEMIVLRLIYSIIHNNIK